MEKENQRKNRRKKDRIRKINAITKLQLSLPVSMQTPRRLNPSIRIR